MSDTFQTDSAGDESVNTLSAETFEPAIHAAVVAAEEAGHSRTDILSALSNGYMRTLIVLLGESGAAGLLEAQAAHVRKLGGGI
jgi:hypothetical protein